jgi:adenylate cyclase
MVSETNIERELRFVVDARESKPWRVEATAIAIEQHYLPFSSFVLHGASLNFAGVHVMDLDEEQQVLWNQQPEWVARIRKKGDAYIFTSKSYRSADSSFEIEGVISEPTFHDLRGHASGGGVQKTRYVWPIDGVVWEIDEYEGAFAGFVIAEVELNIGQELKGLPEWVGHEITGIEAFSNRSLAKMTMK